MRQNGERLRLVAVALPAAGVPVVAAGTLAMSLAVALPVALAVTLVAFRLAVPFLLDTIRTVTATLAIVLAVVHLDSHRLRRLPGMSRVTVVPLVLVNRVLLLRRLALLVRRRRALLLRAGADRVAVPEMRRQRMHGDRDRHERVLLRVRVVAARPLRRRVLGI